MAPRDNAIYRGGVSSPSLSPDEIRAAAETHRDLGPEYQSAVIESFLDRVGREIDARVDARLAAARMPPPQPVRQQRERSPLALAIVSISLGVPLSAIAVAAGSHPPGFPGLLVIWLAIAVINVAYNRRS
jgi:hypothetical protein